MRGRAIPVDDPCMRARYRDEVAVAGAAAGAPPSPLIGVRANPLEQFKPLEYPDLVVSGGATIVDPVAH